jgi:hypothetical protein
VGVASFFGYRVQGTGYRVQGTGYSRVGWGTRDLAE